MKGQAFIIFFAVLGLGLFGLWYVVLNHVMTTQVEVFASASITEGNQTAYQTLYGYVWDALPFLAVISAFLFIVLWSQRRRIEEL